MRGRRDGCIGAMGAVVTKPHAITGARAAALPQQIQLSLQASSAGQLSLAHPTPSVDVASDRKRVFAETPPSKNVERATMTSVDHRGGGGRRGRGGGENKNTRDAKNDVDTIVAASGARADVATPETAGYVKNVKSDVSKEKKTRMMWTKRRETTLDEALQRLIAGSNGDGRDGKEVAVEERKTGNVESWRRQLMSQNVMVAPKDAWRRVETLYARHLRARMSTENVEQWTGWCADALKEWTARVWRSSDTASLLIPIWHDTKDGNSSSSSSSSSSSENGSSENRGWWALADVDVRTHCISYWDSHLANMLDENERNDEMRAGYAGRLSPMFEALEKWLGWVFFRFAKERVPWQRQVRLDAPQDATNANEPNKAIDEKRDAVTPITKSSPSLLSSSLSSSATGGRGESARYVLAAARHILRHRHLEDATTPTPVPTLVWTEAIERMSRTDLVPQTRKRAFKFGGDIGGGSDPYASLATGVSVDPSVVDDYLGLLADGDIDIDIDIHNQGGGSNSGGNDSGGNDSGGNDSGGNDSGGNDSGGNDSGGNDSGGNDDSGPEASAVVAVPVAIGVRCRQLYGRTLVTQGEWDEVCDRQMVRAERWRETLLRAAAAADAGSDGGDDDDDGGGGEDGDAEQDEVMPATILFPVHRGGDRWALVDVNVGELRMTYWDSRRSRTRPALTRVIRTTDNYSDGDDDDDEEEEDDDDDDDNESDEDEVEAEKKTVDREEGDDEDGDRSVKSSVWKNSAGGDQTRDGRRGGGGGTKRKREADKGAANKIKQMKREETNKMTDGDVDNDDVDNDDDDDDGDDVDDDDVEEEEEEDGEEKKRALVKVESADRRAKAALKMVESWMDEVTGRCVSRFRGTWRLCVRTDAPQRSKSERADGAVYMLATARHIVRHRHGRRNKPSGANDDDDDDDDDDSNADANMPPLVFTKREVEVARAEFSKTLRGPSLPITATTCLTPLTPTPLTPTPLTPTPLTTTTTITTEAPISKCALDPYTVATPPPFFFSSTSSSLQVPKLSPPKPSVMPPFSLPASSSSSSSFRTTVVAPLTPPMLTLPETSAATAGSVRLVNPESAPPTNKTTFVTTRDGPTQTRAMARVGAKSKTPKPAVTKSHVTDNARKAKEAASSRGGGGGGDETKRKVTTKK
jgi:hypothetical protein